MRRRLALALSLALAAVGVAYGFLRFSTRAMPAGQPPLATVTAAVVDQLHADFNAHTDRVRLIALLSPT